MTLQDSLRYLDCNLIVGFAKKESKCGNKTLSWITLLLSFPSALLVARKIIISTQPTNNYSLKTSRHQHHSFFETARIDLHIIAFVPILG